MQHIPSRNVSHAEVLHTGHTYCSGSVTDMRVNKQNFDDAFKKVRPSVSKKVRAYLMASDLFITR